MCTLALMIQILDANDAVSFFKCALNVRFLPRITPKRRGVMLTRTLLVSMKTEGCQVLSLNQVEKGHTSLLSALKFYFYSWLQINTEFTTGWAAASSSSFLHDVVKIEKSSAKNVITAWSLSEEPKLLMYNRNGNGTLR